MRAMKPWQAALSSALLDGRPITDVAPERQAAKPADSRAAAVHPQPASKWFLARWLDALDERQVQREREAMEAFLSDATDIADLEDRMRRWDKRASSSSYGLRGYNYF
jgi:Protein of unknown function (DUF3563)